MSGTDRLLGRGLVIKEGYGPWAVVTGASSGIGREMAVQLAGAGMNLLLVARRGLLLQDLAGELSRSTGVLVKTLVLDLSRESATAELIAATEDIDVGLYVGAAGFGSSGLFIDSTVDREKDMIMVNCLAVLTQTHHFARRFAKRGSGGLVLMGSLVGFQGAPLAGHYAATKAYIQSFAEALHRELKPLGVDVISSAPGPTHSGFAESAGMTMANAMAASKVAEQTLRALGYRATVLPGILTKVLAYSLAMLPRHTRVFVMGKVMRGMVSSKDEGDEAGGGKALRDAL